MKQVYIFIYLPGETVAVPAGLLEYDPQEMKGLFRYGSRYLQRENALPVDPIELPFGKVPAAVTTNGGIPGAIRDGAPDFWGRVVISHGMGKTVKELDEATYLLESNASRVGNLDFRTSEKAPEPAYRPPTFQDLAELVAAADKLQRNEKVREDLQQLLAQGTSMGGARPKCCIEMDGALWIAKFHAKGDEWNNARVEHATMSIAAACGVAIPEMRIHSMGEHDALFVRRFDREKVTNGYAREGFMSGLSFMQWHEGDRPNFSYVAIADRIRQTGASPQASLPELFRRMVCNIFCRNTDDHPRNHGFLLKRGVPVLSPAYDITPTAAARGIGTEFSLAMEIGPLGKVGTIENALGGCSRFGLDEEEAEVIIHEMACQVQEWRCFFEESGVSPEDTARFEASFDSLALEHALRLGGRGPVSR